MRVIGRAVRAWALAEPARYALLFGSPVAGYDAPAGQTTGPGTRVVVRLVEVWEDAWRAGEVSVDESALAPRRLSRDLARIRRQMGITAPDALIARGLFGWAALFGQYGPDTFAQPGDLVEHHLDALVDMVGLG